MECEKNVLRELTKERFNCLEISIGGIGSEV